jgi:hypothetical protein
MTDEEWVDLNAADDDVWYARVEGDFGMVIRPKTEIRFPQKRAAGE